LTINVKYQGQGGEYHKNAEIDFLALTRPQIVRLLWVKKRFPGRVFLLRFTL